MFKKILIVCEGNICRSPTAQYILKGYLSEKEICSAGINALVGHSVDERAKAVALQNGVNLEDHRATQLTTDMCRDKDLILVMEKKHIKAIEKIAPLTKGKIKLFGYGNNNVEIFDPYKMDLAYFQIIYNMLIKSAQYWAEVLR